MDLLNKIDKLIIDTTVAGDVAQNKAQGHVDVVGGECPEGYTYDKKKKVCVPIKNESTTVGATYASGNSTIAGSGQTRIWGSNVQTRMIDLARKEPVELQMDDPTDTNILGRKGLKFDKKSGAYIPDFWTMEKK